MGIQVPLGEYNCTFIFECDGSTKTPTWGLGFRWTGSLGSPPEPAELAELVAETFSDPVGGERPYRASVMSNEWVFQGCSVALQTVDGPLVGEYIDPIRGTVTLPTLPINCSSLFTKNTSAGGRRNKGRAYIPPCDYGEAIVSGAGVVPGSQVTFINARYSVALGVLEAVNVIPVLFHSDGAGSTIVNSLTMGTTIATQRRRLR